MSVGTISLVGISIVFLSFLVLYIMFRLLELIFGDKGEKKTTLKKMDKSDIKPVSNNKNVFIADNSVTDDTEIVAVISAAIAMYCDKPMKIISIKENKGNKLSWINHRSKIWRPVRKGVKRTW